MKRWIFLLIIFGMMGFLIVFSGCESGGTSGCTCDLSACVESCIDDCIDLCTYTCTNCELNGNTYDCSNPASCIVFFAACSCDLTVACMDSMCESITDPQSSCNTSSSGNSSSVTEIPDMGPCSSAVDLVEGVDYEVIRVEAGLDYVCIELQLLKTYTDIEVCYEIYAQPGNVKCEDDYTYSSQATFSPGNKFSYISNHTFRYGPRDAESYTIVITSVRGLE